MVPGGRCWAITSLMCSPEYAYSNGESYDFIATLGSPPPIPPGAKALSGILPLLLK